MDVIANNIANANTTRTPQGGAFKRQLVVFAQKPGATSATDDADEDQFDPTQPVPAQVEGVQALGIVDDPSPDRLVFDPGNPDADPRGYVHYPNVEVVKEMVDLMAASRAYQANVAAIAANRQMGTNDLSLLKS
jgi:flagellar basal-body rod protein FlgC